MHPTFRQMTLAGVAAAVAAAVLTAPWAAADPGGAPPAGPIRLAEGSVDKKAAPPKAGPDKKKGAEQKTTETPTVPATLPAVAAPAAAAPATPPAAPAPAAQADLAAGVSQGKKIALDRASGNCIACHLIAGGESPGTIGPPLVAMQVRYPSKDKLREQIFDPTKANPVSAMPPFGKNQILTEAQLNQVVEFIWSL